MRYYIEAYDHDGRQILGNLDGQAALGDVLAPERCAAWLRIKRCEVRVSARVAYWRLVDENDRERARIDNYSGSPRLPDPRPVTCGSCGKSWDEALDPAPAALCHWCHGRGESWAEITG